ncbi:Uncharacterised protein [Mycobacterium tuberculosis]|nr:Uncharacterised protein [Mycobacterium tuberculosis]
MNTTTRPANHCGGADSAGWAGIGSSAAAEDVSIALHAKRMVSQLSQEKFPDPTSHSWVTTMIAAAMLAAGCGVNNPNGTTSWAKWLPATSIRCNGLGR